MMASRSRSTQEKLSGLEDAQIEDQLAVAAQFVNFDPDSAVLLSNSPPIDQICFYGREEWVLKWLLKKLQATGDLGTSSRLCPISWKLFCHIIKIIPPPNVARVLNERKFLAILRSTLEDVQQSVSQLKLGERDDPRTTGPEPGNHPDVTRSSKKRKRSGEVVGDSGRADGVYQVAEAILESISYLVQCAESRSKTDNGPDVTYSQHYTKSILRTTTEEAGRIFSSWVSLCQTILLNCPNPTHFSPTVWLLPFLQIWESHIPEANDMMLFSTLALTELLHLFAALDEERVLSKPGLFSADWKIELEQILARHLLVSLKGAFEATGEPDALAFAVESSVPRRPQFAAIIFDVAVRSIPAQRTRRRLEDTKWLEAVFRTLKDAVYRKASLSERQALDSMLRTATGYQVDLDLQLLRSVVSQSALTSAVTDWSLLSTVLRLDANLFLIPEDSMNLLQDLLHQITQSCTNPDWLDKAPRIIDDVLVPLMTEFSKARNLVGFIHHWHAGLVQAENLHSEPGSQDVLSAWEDEALHANLKMLMELSLTVQQICNLLDWLESKATSDGLGPSIVIADAVAAAVTSEQTADAVGLRLMQMALKCKAESSLLKERYSWRIWRVVTRTLQFADARNINDALLNELQAFLINAYSSNRSFVSRDMVEAFRCTSALWCSLGQDNKQLSSTAEVLSMALKQLSEDVFTPFVAEFTKHGSGLDAGYWGKRHMAVSLGSPYAVCAYSRCLLIEYPKVMGLLSYPTESQEYSLWRAIFVVSSMTSSTNSGNAAALAEMWISFLEDGFVLNTHKIISSAVNAMLDYSSVASSSYSAFAAICLLKLPLDVLTRQQRERIMGSSNARSRESIDPSDVSAWIALRSKIMQRPSLYSGAAFNDLIEMGSTVAALSPVSRSALYSFGKLAAQTLGHVIATADQPRSQEYLRDATKFLGKQKKIGKSKQEYPMIKLRQTVFSLQSASARLQELNIITAEDLTQSRTSFVDVLVSELTALLRKPGKFGAELDARGLFLLCLLDALDVISEHEDMDNLITAAQACVGPLKSHNQELGAALELFIMRHSSGDGQATLDGLLQGDTSTNPARVALRQSVKAVHKHLQPSESVVYTTELLGERAVGLSLGKLLAVKHSITSLPTQSSSEGSMETDSMLSSIYSKLAAQLPTVTGSREFALVSEILETILQTHPRAISQFNIDETLGSISVICSRSGPFIRPSRAGTVLIHLCHLIQAILANHRFKLQGHFHLLVQTLQVLLQALFAPYPHSTIKTSASPPWLSPAYALGPHHAASYTRLLTLICDPTVSSVTRSKDNALTSATAKAKRIAGQHIPVILMTYIKCQLEMQMAGDVKQKLLPGIYAILETTTAESRRVLGEQMDASGRAILGALWRDYTRYGQWKGN